MDRLLFLIVFLYINTPVALSQQPGLQTGSIAPLIRLPDPKGDTIPLTSFRGRLVLIDFWASWCAPCVKEQPELAKLYRQYKFLSFKNGKGFEIYGVSLDARRSAWEDNIKELNITWTQVSDLKYWSSPVAKIYKIQALPFNVLIDGNGTILAINLHSDELKQFIKGLLIIR
jgi:thiol-disulfide isomerase/thioredoxin